VADFIAVNTMVKTNLSRIMMNKSIGSGYKSKMYKCIYCIEDYDLLKITASDVYAFFKDNKENKPS
jgi:hypothetical protein